MLNIQEKSYARLAKGEYVGEKRLRERDSPLRERERLPPPPPPPTLTLYPVLEVNKVLSRRVASAVDQASKSNSDRLVPE